MPFTFTESDGTQTRTDSYSTSTSLGGDVPVVRGVFFTINVDEEGADDFDC